jgi:dephospho-CoA kinase
VAIGTPGLETVIAEFGEQMRGPGGGLDRAKLASVVFNDEPARQRLNAIVHPLIANRVAELMSAAQEADPDGVIINDVPLIVESDAAGRYELVVVVDAPESVQLDRLIRSRGMSEDDARARMAVQATRDQRLAIADHVIVNDGDLEALEEAVDAVWAELRSRQADLSGSPRVIARSEPDKIDRP